MAETLVGKVVHYYDHLGVAVFELTQNLKVGSTVHIKGAHDDFSQGIKEIQYEHEAISEGPAGKQVGVRVDQKVHENDQVFVVT